MSTQVQDRRDTAANLAAFVGAQGEVLVDTTNNRLVVFDGSTAGGFAAAKQIDLAAETAQRIAADQAEVLARGVAISTAIAAELAGRQADVANLTASLNAVAASVAAEVTARQTAVAAEAAARAAGDATNAAAIATNAAAIAAETTRATGVENTLATALAGKASTTDLAANTSFANALYPIERPGDAAGYFTPGLAPNIRAAGGFPNLDPATLATDAEGAVTTLGSAYPLCLKRFEPMEPDRVYGARVAFTVRTTGNKQAINFGLFCFDANKALISTTPTILRAFTNLDATSLRQSAQFQVTRVTPVPAGQVGVDPATRYVRLFVQNTDPVQVVNVEVIRWSDTSDASTNATSVASEVSRATAAEGALGGQISAEAARAGGAEAALGTQIAAEATRATAAEGTNATAITAEKNRALAAEGAEATRAGNAEATIANSVTAEVSRATTAEAGLANRLATQEGTNIIVLDANASMAFVDPNGFPIASWNPLTNRLSFDNDNPEVPGFYDANVLKGVTDGAGNTIAFWDYQFRLTSELATPDVPNAYHQDAVHAVTDGNGNTLGFYDRNSRLNAEIVEPNAATLYDATRRVAITDSNGNPLGIWNNELRFETDFGVPPWSVYTKVYSGNARRAYAWTEGFADSLDISRGEFDDVLEAHSGGRYAIYTGQNAGSPPVKKSAYLTPKSNMASSVTNVTGFIGDGQSLMVSFSSLTAINTVPLDPTRASMFNGGVRILAHEHADPNEAVPVPWLNDWVPLCEALSGFSGETIATMMANVYLRGAPATEGICVAMVGVGSQKFVALQPGTVSWNNFMAVAVRMVQVAVLTGKTMNQIIFGWRQGNSDGNVSDAVYQANLIYLQSAASAFIKRCTGQTVEVIIVMDQFSTFNDLSTTGPVTAPLNLARTQPTKFACIGPNYWFHFADGLHPLALYQAWGGGYWGRWLKRYLIDGVTERALNFTATRSGSVVTLTARDAVGRPLAIDDGTYVTDPGGIQPAGLLWHDSNFLKTDGSAVTNLSTTVSGTTATMQLSGVPAGTNQQVWVGGYCTTPGQNGGWNTGPRCLIRDTSGIGMPDGHPDTVTIAGTVYPMPYWAGHDIAPVTTLN